MLQLLPDVTDVVPVLTPFLYKVTMASDGLLLSILVQLPETVTFTPVATEPVNTGAAVQTGSIVPKEERLMDACAFTAVIQAAAVLENEASLIPYISDRLPCKDEEGEVTVVIASLTEDGLPIADMGMYQS